MRAKLEFQVSGVAGSDAIKFTKEVCWGKKCIFRKRCELETPYLAPAEAVISDIKPNESINMASCQK